MLAKHPFEVPTGRKLSKEEVTYALRLSIIAELDAVNLYLQLANAIEDDDVRKVFIDIAREEKTHVGEFLTLLKRLDPEQVAELERGEREVKEILSTSVEKNNPHDGFEEKIIESTRRTVEASRVVSKKIPVIKVGKGSYSVPLERVNEQPQAVPLIEVSQVFKVSRRAVDYALSTGLPIDAPELYNASIKQALSEDALIVETILKGNVNTLRLSNWDEPGKPVEDVVQALSQLGLNGFRRPYVVLLHPHVFSKLLKVSEKTGLTDYDRLRQIVDDVVNHPSIPRDKVIVLSSTSEVLDVAYGGDAEVDFIGPENGFYVFRVWSTIAVRVKNPQGVIVLSPT